MKVLDGRMSALSRLEKGTLDPFAVNEHVQTVAVSTISKMGSQNPPSFVKQVKKKKQPGVFASPYEYPPLRLTS